MNFLFYANSNYWFGCSRCKLLDFSGEVVSIGYKGRDVEVAFEKELCVVVACDSCGAIGEKELDVVKVSNYIAGRFSTRVALFEVLTTSAQPKVISAAICNEPDPTGEEILRGLKDELKLSGVGLLPIAISSEKNMPTQQTGIGITVVGMCDVGELRIATTGPGDSIYCLGVPKVGPEVHSPEDPDIVQAEHLRILQEEPKIHDIVPVGSQGIQGEIRTLATALNLSFSAVNPSDSGGQLNGDSNWPETLDIYKSGGPSTCVLFTAAPGFKKELILNKLGKLDKSIPFIRLGSFQK